VAADDTIDRVARRLEEGEPVEKLAPFVARGVISARTD
jgi:hypothetical protein